MGGTTVHGWPLSPCTGQQDEWGEGGFPAVGLRAGDKTATRLDRRKKEGREIPGPFS